MRGPLAAAVALLLLAGCAVEPPRQAGPRPLTAEEGRARVAAKLPPKLDDRAGWATDIYAAFATLQLDPSVENICSVVAVTAQESGFKVDPPVPNLPELAAREIERQRARAGVPKLVLETALALPSSEGPSYADRLAQVRTEKELSDVFEDFIDRVPLGRRFLEDRNPIRTGGPMQVSIAYARAHAQRRPYPYPMKSIRDEVFTRRGGMYFGIAHLLDYPADYDTPLYRYADFNAGHYASRNAAFQRAVTQVSGVPLELDGDLLAATEAAVRTLGGRLRLDDDDIRSDLKHAGSYDFAKTRLYRRVFELADRAGERPAPRAVVPRIALQGAKITRPLTTEWFARRVEARYKECLKR